MEGNYLRVVVRRGHYRDRFRVSFFNSNSWAGLPLLDATTSEICDALMAYEGREEKVRFEFDDGERIRYFLVDLDSISSAKFDFGDYLLKSFNVAF